jgi:hypothetical protein
VQLMKPPPPSSVTDEFIINKHALDQFLNTKFNYKVASETHTTTIIDALKMLRNNPFGFNFIDVIQTYIELLRKDVHLDDSAEFKLLISRYMDLLEPWVGAQSMDADERKRKLPVRLDDVLKNKCEIYLSGRYAYSENISQMFMHKMVKKLCDFFKLSTDAMMRKPDFDINKEVHLGSTLYFFLLHCDQLLLPILEQIRIENQTPKGKEMIKVFNPRIHAYVKGGRRTRHKRSGKSGHKRSAHKKRSGKRSGKR